MANTTVQDDGVQESEKSNYATLDFSKNSRQSSSLSSSPDNMQTTTTTTTTTIIPPKRGVKPLKQSKVYDEDDDYGGGRRVVDRTRPQSKESESDEKNRRITPPPSLPPPPLPPHPPPPPPPPSSVKVSRTTSSSADHPPMHTKRMTPNGHHHQRTSEIDEGFNDDESFASAGGGGPVCDENDRQFSTAICIFSTVLTMVLVLMFYLVGEVAFRSILLILSFVFFITLILACFLRRPSAIVFTSSNHPIVSSIRMSPTHTHPHHPHPHPHPHPHHHQSSKSPFYVMVSPDQALYRHNKSMQHFEGSLHLSPMSPSIGNPNTNTSTVTAVTPLVCPIHRQPILSPLLYHQHHPHHQQAVNSIMPHHHSSNMSLASVNLNMDLSRGSPAMPTPITSSSSIELASGLSNKTTPIPTPPPIQTIPSFVAYRSSNGDKNNGGYENGFDCHSPP